MVYDKLESFPKGHSCCFCFTRTVDPLKLGYIYRCKKISAHYFCLLLASHGVQRGTDKQGLLGFLLKDIKTELKRGSHIKCAYCHRNGATVVCSKKGCKTMFHLPCGLRENSLHFFLNEFKSLCVKHRSRISLPARLKFDTINGPPLCILCFNTINIKDHYSLIWPPCCKPSSLLHKLCLQKMAYCAGYYFKCPFCANEKMFSERMRKSGIFIPSQEASWESDESAYSDFRVEQSCHAASCRCPQGCEFNRPNSKWYLCACKFCGSNAVHVECSGIWRPGLSYSIDWKCNDCNILKTDNKMQNGNFNHDEGRNNMEESGDDSDTYMSTVEYFFVNIVDLDEVKDKCRVNEFNGTRKLYISRQGLNETLKNVSNNVEVIYNNKRSVVLL